MAQQRPSDRRLVRAELAAVARRLAAHVPDVVAESAFVCVPAATRGAGVCALFPWKTKGDQQWA